MTKPYSSGEPVHYQALRSVSDNHAIVICWDDGFYDLPDHVRPIAAHGRVCVAATCAT